MSDRQPHTFPAGTVPATEELYDSSKPYHIMHTHFEKGVAKALLEAERMTVFRDMSDGDKSAVLIEGILTGLCIAFLIGTDVRAPDDLVIKSVEAAVHPALGNARDRFASLMRSRIYHGR